MSFHGLFLGRLGRTNGKRAPFTAPSLVIGCKLVVNAYRKAVIRGVDDGGRLVWFDEAVLELGDSFRRKIDEDLARSRYGIVILSPRFFA